MIINAVEEQSQGIQIRPAGGWFSPVDFRGHIVEGAFARESGLIFRLLVSQTEVAQHIGAVFTYKNIVRFDVSMQKVPGLTFSKSITQVNADFSVFVGLHHVFNEVFIQLGGFFHKD